MNDIISSETPAKKKRKSGRKKFQETRHPIYRGVRERKGKWVCEIREPRNNKSRLWLGTFESPDMAARAYDIAASALGGDEATLNFPTEEAKKKKVEIVVDNGGEGSLGINENDDDDNNCINNVFVDEEELFNMHGLIDGLAEGLILTPPALKRGFSWDNYNTNHCDDCNNNDHHGDSLWSSD